MKKHLSGYYYVLGNLAVIVLLLTGCASGKNYVIGESSQNLPIGTTYAEVAPRLVSENVQWGEGDAQQNIAWNSTKAFGPVPAWMQQRGDKICQSVGASRAIGYHPLAEDLQGKPIRGGGFYCG